MLTRVLAIAAVLLLLSVPVMAEAAQLPVLTDPTAAALATAAGIAAVVALITNVLRGVVPEDLFDRWGPTIAVCVGVGLAVAGFLTGPGPRDGSTLVTAVLVGLFGGWQSQAVNTQVSRARRTASSDASPGGAPTGGPG